MGKISKKEEAVENTIKKPTYEELEQFCNQLSVQNKFFRE